MYKVVVTTVLNNVVYSGVSKKDLSKFSEVNKLRNQLQLKYGSDINVSFQKETK